MANEKTLLLVDDDPMVLTVVGQILRHFHYSVRCVASGEEALERCERASIDLAILDAAMPGLSGIETAQQLRRRFQVPFIFLTASRSEALLEAALSEGAFGYLVKPVAPDAVVPAVESALRRAAELHHVSRAGEATRDIKLAIGWLMGREGLSEHAAEARLRALARPQGRRMVTVARELLDSVVPGRGPRDPASGKAGADDVPC